MFKVVWDNGKPDSKDCADKAEVEKLLNDLMHEAAIYEYPYFDILVYDEQDQDVTNLFLN